MECSHAAADEGVMAKGASLLLQVWVNNSQLQSGKSFAPDDSQLEHGDVTVLGGVFSDEGGVHGAGVLRISGSSLEKLFYQSRLLLLQLGDPLAPLCHLLHEEEEMKRVTVLKQH